MALTVSLPTSFLGWGSWKVALTRSAQHVCVNRALQLSLPQLLKVAIQHPATRCRRTGCSKIACRVRCCFLFIMPQLVDRISLGHCISP